MKDCITELVAYVEQGSADAVFSDLEQHLGADNLRLVAIIILGWLRGLPACSHREGGLLIPRSAVWRQYLELAIAETELRELFIISDCELQFLDQIVLEERNDIRQYVRREYKPRLMK